MLLENPVNSIREAMSDLDKSHWKIYKTLKKYKMHPYKFHRHQKLSENDKERRLNFCRDILARQEHDADLFSKILWSDESSFCTSGSPNKKNLHFWADATPHKILEIKRSGRRSLHVWCGILRNKIIGPIFFQNNLTGARYMDLLDDVENRLDELPLNMANTIIFQQDGATPHNVVQVTERLNANFDVWIGKHGVISWPPNSPDLTPLDTFLWGTLKNKIYFKSSENILEIQARVTNEINNINNTHPDWITKAINKLKIGYQKCIEANGGHFEHIH